MIQFVRNMFSSKLGVVFALVFITTIALAFGLADINTPSGMFSSDDDNLATVGGNGISEEPIQQIMNRALASAREQQPGLDMAAFIDSGGLDEAIEQYTRAIALSGFAEDIDLLVGKALVDQTITETPAFQGLSGQFDEATFRQVLQGQNISEQEVRTDLQRQTLFRLILGPAAAVAQFPESVVRPYVRLLLEQRSGAVIAVPSAAMAEGAAPTQAEINSFYQANLRRYTLPERRAIRFAIFTRDQIPATTPTEEQIRDYYQSHDSEYAGSESRALRQIILPSEEQARTFYSAVKGGKSFTAAAGERGFSEASTRVTAESQSQFAQSTSDAVARAAFAADRGALTEPARSDLGWHVIEVDSITQRNAKPLASVRSEIVAALSETLANDALANFYLAIENAIDSGASFEEVARAQNLTIETTPPLAPNGQSPDDASFTPGPNTPALVEAAFSMDADEDPVLVPLEENSRYALVDVTEIKRSAPQPLVSIRQLVAQDFMRDRASGQARRVAAQIASRINDGATPSQAIAAAGIALPPPQRAAASRQQLAQMQNAPEPLRLMFRMAAGTAKLVQLPADQGWFVVALESIDIDEAAMTPQLISAAQGQFGQVVANEYAQQFLNAVMQDYPVERNEDAIGAFSDRLTGRTR